MTQHWILTVIVIVTIVVIGLARSALALPAGQESARSSSPPPSVWGAPDTEILLKKSGKPENGSGKKLVSTFGGRGCR